MLPDCLAPAENRMEVAKTMDAADEVFRRKLRAAMWNSDTFLRKQRNRDIPIKL